MKMLFTVVLILNFLVEALAATTLIGGPGGVSVAGQGGQWSMHYGFAVIAIATAVFWTWPHRDNLRVVTAVLGILSTFHISVFISLAIAGDQQVGMILHATLAALCVLLFSQRSRWCVE